MPYDDGRIRCDKELLALRGDTDNCEAWQEVRQAVAVLKQECRQFVKGVDELRDATGGRTATIYQFAGGLVAYFARDAPDFAEAGEIKGADLAAAQRILDERSMPGGNARCFSAARAPRRLWCVYSGDERYWGILRAKIEALCWRHTNSVPSSSRTLLANHGDSMETDFPASARKQRFSRWSARSDE